MGSFGPMEIGLIFLLILLMFGAKRIPEIARGLGKGLREFKDATKDVQRELTVDVNNRNTAYRPPAQSAPQPQAPPAQPAQAAPPPPAQAAPDAAAPDPVPPAA